MKWIRKIGILLFAVLLWTACNPDVNRHNALGVVSKADSLWHAGQMYGVDAGDSATLAQAYETLSSFNSPLLSIFNSQLSTDYAHACYHYGKLLRAKDNPVEAMQAFINATHSGTDDYHILGRVYNNIGDMCHLAGEFPLSYEMFEQSGNMFLNGNDSLSYYYCLNDMAFELAEQGKKEETLSLIHTIESAMNDKDIFYQTYRTRAILYRNMKMYDSARSVIDSICIFGPLYSSDLVIKAQAMWGLGQRDSALYYANYVMNLSGSSDQDKYNMLYILMNGDKSLSKEDIKALSALRSDIEIGMLIPLHNQLAVAVKLLKQDLSRKLDFRWLYAIIATLVFVGSGLCIYVVRKRYQRNLLTQQVEELTIREKETRTQHDRIVEEHLSYQEGLIKQIEGRCAIFRQSDHLQKELSWNDYEQVCEIVNKHFCMLAQKLKSTHLLNEREIRLCILVFIGGFKGKQLSEWLFYGESGIRNLKSNTARKLGTNSNDLRSFLLKMAIGEQVVSTK